MALPQSLSSLGSNHLEIFIILALTMKMKLSSSVESGSPDVSFSQLIAVLGYENFHAI